MIPSKLSKIPILMFEGNLVLKEFWGKQKVCYNLRHKK